MIDAQLFSKSARQPDRLPASLALKFMNVLALTILVSTSLAGIFIACFAMELRRNRYGSAERDSLLPLDSSTNKPAKKSE